MAVTLLVAPETERCLECPVTEFTHILPFKCQGGESGRMVEQSVRILSARRLLHAVGSRPRAGTALWPFRDRYGYRHSLGWLGCNGRWARMLRGWLRYQGRRRGRRWRASIDFFGPGVLSGRHVGLEVTPKAKVCPEGFVAEVTDVFSGIMFINPLDFLKGHLLLSALPFLFPKLSKPALGPCSIFGWKRFRFTGNVSPMVIRRTSRGSPRGLLASAFTQTPSST